MLQETATGSPQLRETLELSVTPWQFIEGVVTSRPNSSVLSSSDTEEEETLEVAPHRPSGSTEDSRTIEINLNLPVQQVDYSIFKEDASSFILPEVSSDFSDNKILIIGHRKLSFYRSLDPTLRKKFTLDINEPYKIIVVIFDGLIKIGNILHFIKHNGLGGKFLVPLVHNISYKIIEKILKLYQIQLLCMPIQLEDEVSLQNLLDLLSDDFLLESSVAPLDSVQYPLVPLTFREPLPLSPPQRPLIEPSESVIVTHQMEEMKKSKKWKRRHKNESYSLIGLGISLGLGLGVTVALTISYFKAIQPEPPTLMEAQKPDGMADALKSLVKVTKKTLEHGDEVVKHGLIEFKRHIFGISKLIVQGTREYVDDVKSSMDGIWRNADNYINLIML
jgi:hypothetical protein